MVMLMICSDIPKGLTLYFVRSCRLFGDLCPRCICTCICICFRDPTGSNIELLFPSTTKTSLLKEANSLVDHRTIKLQNDIINLPVSPGVTFT